MNKEGNLYLQGYVKTEHKAIVSCCNKGLKNPELGHEQQNARENLFAILSDPTAIAVIDSIVKKAHIEKSFVPPFVRTVIDHDQAQKLCQLNPNEVDALILDSTVLMSPITVVKLLRKKKDVNMYFTRHTQEHYQRLIDQKKGTIPSKCLDIVAVWELNIIYNSNSLFDADKVFNAQILCAPHKEGKPPKYQEDPKSFKQYVKRCAPYFHSSLNTSIPIEMHDTLLRDLSNLFNTISINMIREMLLRVDYCARNASYGDKISLSRFIAEWSTNLAVKMRECAQCGVCRVALSVCARCRSVHYCGKKCQTAHWSSHKKICKTKTKK